MDGELLQKGGRAGVRENQSITFRCPRPRLPKCRSAVKRIVDNEKLLQSMYKHQEAQKSSRMQCTKLYPTNTKLPQNTNKPFPPIAYSLETGISVDKCVHRFESRRHFYIFYFYIILASSPGSTQFLNVEC